MKTAFLLLIIISVFGCSSTKSSLHYGEKLDAIGKSMMTPKPAAPAINNANKARFHTVVVDPKSICKDCNYESDIQQCNDIAQNNTNYAGNAIGNAAAGAATGALICAVAGIDPGICAAGGATGGAIGGLGNEAITVRQMVINCMRGRGYSVLR